MLLQFGVENVGSEAPVISLLSLLTVFLTAGRSGGRWLYSSCQGGGRGKSAGGLLLVTITGTGRGLVLTILLSPMWLLSDILETRSSLFWLMSSSFWLLSVRILETESAPST